MAKVRANAASPSKRRHRTCKHCQRRLHPSNILRHKCMVNTHKNFTAKVNIPVYYPPTRPLIDAINSGILSDLLSEDRRDLPFPTSEAWQAWEAAHPPQPEDANNVEDADEMEVEEQDGSEPHVDFDIDQHLNDNIPPLDQHPDDDLPPLPDSPAGLDDHPGSDGQAEGSAGPLSRSPSPSQQPHQSASSDDDAHPLPLVGSDTSNSFSTASSSSSLSGPDSFESDWSDQRLVYEPLDARQTFLARIPPAMPVEARQQLALARLRKFVHFHSN